MTAFAAARRLGVRILFPQPMPGSPTTGAALTLARYKRLILLGRITLPLEEARRIVGPDCAYHLYFRHATARGGGAEPATATKRRSARRRHR